MSGPCKDCNGRGWAIFNGREVQRCDTCALFKTDEDAAKAVEVGHDALCFIAQDFAYACDEKAEVSRAILDEQEALAWEVRAEEVRAILKAARGHA